MRQGYMAEYQENFNQNTSRRNDKISEMMESISQQELTNKELEKEKNSQKSCMYKFYAQTRNHFRFRVILANWKYYTKCQKRKNRILNYAKNNSHRRRQARLFESWRKVTHAWFKERIDSERMTMKTELESKMLIQWTTKVDALMLYMAQLEDRIKIEQEARQKLAEAYDASLTNGFSRLTLETQMLQVNPLIGEVVIKEFECHK